MLARDIPARLSVSGAPYSSVYQRQPGSLRDPTLYCWFNIEDEGGLDVSPHVSIHIDGNNLFNEMHISFSVLWAGGFGGETTRRSLSFFFLVKEGKVVFTKDNSMSFGRSRSGELLEQVSADSMPSLVRDMTQFAQAFVNKARGPGLPPPRVIDKGPREYIPGYSRTGPGAGLL
ncbi:hypothetical protein SAMN02745857_03948 [Andreprevotia lacus DSM 23236]|uniref:Uncharacterized protein n=1 Tax=Andreprevotia lacus DSM 23236 TaxID=1121001 RepID=A0A1W1Y0B2_9NEIS|nr:hypothetical protein [Andreprevotia lacus]SMC29603.1 hypothetical protein SAMN02745857_03948 [Andreprevotia lacus DSM 23236]